MHGWYIGYKNSAIVDKMADGLLAQLVEHIVHIDGVTGSSPVQTTTLPAQMSGFLYVRSYELLHTIFYGE